MKRSRSELTGGTGDVSPQWMTFSAVQSGADTTTTTTQAIPVQRLPSGTRAQVMEVLKVMWDFPAVVEADSSIACYLSTSSFGTTGTNIGEPRVFAGRATSTAITTSGMVIFERIKLDDLTDGAGHGVLIATDNIYAQVVSASTSLTNTVRLKLLYRWKNVPLPEYIGIVQSQQ